MSDSRVLPAALVASVGLIAWREFRYTGGPPTPHALVAAGIAFSGLMLLDAFAPPLASVLAVGLVLALGYDLTTNKPPQAPESGVAGGTLGSAVGSVVNSGMFGKNAGPKQGRN